MEKAVRDITDDAKRERENNREKDRQIAIVREREKGAFKYPTKICFRVTTLTLIKDNVEYLKSL